MFASRKNNRNVFSTRSLTHHDFKKYPATTSINLSLGNASNNFFSYVKSFKTGPPNPFVVPKNISKPRQGGPDLGYISPKVIKEKEKEEKQQISGFGENYAVSHETLIGHGDELNVSKLAFMHPIKVIF